MPYIKDSYEERNGWGELTGYLNARRCRPACRSATLPPKTRAGP